MELELKKDNIFCYETVEELTCTQEETLEAIVPDACPDILRIIDVCGQVFVTGKQVEEGRVTVSGIIAAVLLYQPDQQSGICHMEATLPFSCKAEISMLKPADIVHTTAHLRCADARLLNPRKVLIRSDIVLAITAFQSAVHSVSSSVISAERYNICERQMQTEHYQLSDVSERVFSFTDEIRFPHGGEAVPSLLSCRAQARCLECRLIGAKVIFKGTVELDLLLYDVDGTLSQRHESLPFSQILETNEAQEHSVCHIQADISAMKCVVDSSDDCRLLFEAELLAQARIYTQNTVVFLTDLYSTTHETQGTQESFLVCKNCEHLTCPENIRELLETTDLVRSVVDSRVTFGAITQQRDGNRLCLCSNAYITVLYLDESQQLQQLTKEVPLQCQLDRIPETLCNSCRICAGELLMIPMAGGIEIRLNVEFHCQLTQYEEISFTACAQMGTVRQQEGVRPSVVLRLASSDESLWDLAKVYGTTTQRILQANELEDGELFSGKMLLIPSGR